MMPVFQKILVPVDFSRHSDEAVRMGAELAQRYHASLTLVHVFEPLAYTLPQGYVVPTDEQMDALFAEFAQSLNRAKDLALKAGATTVDVRQLDGLAATEITGLAASGNYDLIVMGTHGARGFDRVLMGSVAEKVVRSAACAVLTVRAPALTN